MAGRSLAGYLALPRPDEAVAKAPLALLGYGLVHVAGASDAVPPATALLAWAVFELVLYQARYMLNDLADAEVDQQHVAAEGRKRLPPGERARRWSAAVMVGRVVAGLAVVALLPDPARRITLAAALGVALATAAYERARSPMRRAATPPPDPGAAGGPVGPGAAGGPVGPGAVGGPGSGAAGLPVAPPPGRVAPGGAGEGRGDRPLFLRRRGALAVMVLVGAGYAIRVGLGVALAGPGGAVVLAATVLGWLFGTTGVVGAWLLEVAGLRQGGDTTVLASKAHLATIGDLVGDDPAHGAQPALRGGGAHLVAALLAAAAVAAVLVGVGLGGSPGPVRLGLLLVLAAGVVPGLLAGWPSRWAGLVAVVVAVGAAAALATGDGRAEMVLLLATVVTTPAVFRTFTPSALHLQPAEPASPGGSPVGSPADPGGASPGATTAPPGPARGRDGAAARSRPGSSPAGRR
jgi:hypothetical protein